MQNISTLKILNAVNLVSWNKYVYKCYFSVSEFPHISSNGSFQHIIYYVKKQNRLRGQQTAPKKGSPSFGGLSIYVTSPKCTIKILIVCIIWFII